MQRVSGLIAAVGGMVLVSAAGAAETDWSQVDQAMGKPGTNQPGGVHKFGLPRSDLTVTVDGVVIKPLHSHMTMPPSSRKACARRCIWRT